MPNDAVVSAVAQQQADSIHQDGFAGPRLAGDRAHSGRQFQFQIFNNGEITNAYLGQHGGLIVR
jgi:hypothetical protein